MNHLVYMVNIIAADDLAPQGARGMSNHDIDLVKPG